MYLFKVVEDPYKNCSCISNLVNYILHKRNPNGGTVTFYGGYIVDVHRAAEQMMRLKSYFHKTDGREMQHFIVSFDDDIQPYDAWIIGMRIAAYYANSYQIVFAVHEDTENIHIHFVFNTVSVIDGKKYCEFWSDQWRLKSYIKQVYDEYMKM